MTWAMPWLIGLLLAAPALFLRFPPMNDLPLHEAVVSVLRHYNDRAYFPEGLYELNLGQPNQAFYGLAWLASLFVRVPVACKIVVAGAITAIPVCTARLARYLERPVWCALLAAPLGLGWLFFWGVIANMIGLAALLALLPTLDRASARPSVKGAMASAAALAGLYLAHEAMLLVACVAVGLFAVLQPITRRDTTLRLAPLAPMLVLALFQLAWQDPLRTSNNRAIPILTRGVWHKLANAPGVICYDPKARLLVLFCALVPIVWLASRRARKTAPASEATLRERLYALRFELLVAVLLLGYFVFPHTLHGATLVYQRFLAPAYAIAVVLAAPRGDEKLPFALCLSTVTSPLAALLAILPACFECDRVYRDFETLLSHVDYASTYMTVELDPFEPHQLVRPLNLQAHAVALRGGRTVFDITQSPISPAVMTLDHRWSESSSRLQHDPGSLIPSFDLKRYRYIFVHASEPGAPLGVAGRLRHYARFVEVKGSWALFESTLPTMPIMAPEGPPPPASAATLRTDSGGAAP